MKANRVFSDEYEDEYGGIRNERGSTEPTRNERYPKHVFIQFSLLWLLYSPPSIGRQNELGPSQLLVRTLLPLCLRRVARRLLLRRADAARSRAVLLVQAILQRKKRVRAFTKRIGSS